jgi:hypothetical protein
MVDRSMSSLPPYNPPPSKRRLWLLNSEGSAAERERLLASTGARQVIEVGDGEGLLDRVRTIATEAAVVAPEAVLEGLLLELVGGRPGAARIRFLPGCLTQVQILEGRAVVRHLNVGAPL